MTKIVICAWVLASVAARAWAASGSDVDRLRRWAGGAGIPAVLDGDDDFRWAVLRRLATLDALSENEIDQAAAADRSLAGSLAALGVRAVRPCWWCWTDFRIRGTPAPSCAPPRPSALPASCSSRAR